MKKLNSAVKETLIWAVVSGNILFVLWILYNGINEGFAGTVPEKISYITLMALLVVNSMLLLLKRTGENKTIVA